jgi:hypothetical protein
MLRVALTIKISLHSEQDIQKLINEIVYKWIYINMHPHVNIKTITYV